MGSVDRSAASGHSESAGTVDGLAGDILLDCGGVYGGVVAATQPLRGIGGWHSHLAGYASSMEHMEAAILALATGVVHQWCTYSERTADLAVPDISMVCVRVCRACSGVFTVLRVG